MVEILKSLLVGLIPFGIVWGLILLGLWSLWAIVIPVCLLVAWLAGDTIRHDW